MHAYIHTYIHTCMHTCMYVYMHTCMHAYIHTYIHTHIHTCMYVYIHTYIHAYIRTYIHTYIRHSCESDHSSSSLFRKYKHRSLSIIIVPQIKYCSVSISRLTTHYQHMTLQKYCSVLHIRAEQYLRTHMYFEMCNTPILSYARMHARVRAFRRAHSHAPALAILQSRALALAPTHVHTLK